MSRNYKRNVIFAVIIACSVLLSACAILEVSKDPSESMTNVATEPTTAPEKPEDSANEETKENVTEDTSAGPDDSSCATQPAVSDDNGGEGKDDVEETKPADTETSAPTEAPATEATEVPTTEATEVPATEATEPESKPNLWLEPVEPTVADTTDPAASDPLAPETDAMEKNEAGESVPEETVPVETTPSVPEPDPVDLVYSAGKSEEVLAEMNKRGSCGRLFIPSVGVDVALFEATMYDSKVSQPIVDANDSAAYMADCVPWWGFPVVADHVHQGFSAIKKSVAGETVAYMHFGDHVDAYMCTRVFRGYNEGTLTDLDGNPIKGTNPGGLCMYTCNSDGTVTITFWQPVGQSEH